MREALEQLQRNAEAEMNAAKSQEDLLTLRTKYLGRKGSLTQVLRQLGNVPVEERRLLGQLANEIKEGLSAKIDGALTALASRDRGTQLLAERLDVTLPGRRFPLGGLHPITQVAREICDIFSRLGFEIAEGPEVEFDYYNFEALNIPKDHPARDMQDTFYISGNVLLRTHTSPVQIRVME
ncbi:MAG: phenylalanyl-tRNA synthetase alpha chain, partial [Deltaproteobacteria bacterium]|nr:phenylalanyl-tRNA synthetase alpha chain [Deltaproteobacteria bacterium]